LAETTVQRDPADLKSGQFIHTKSQTKSGAAVGVTVNLKLGQFNTQQEK
jgi:hypothetical protein